MPEMVWGVTRKRNNFGVHIMSFKDFNDEGPGTFAWDYVLCGNTKE